MPIFIAFIKLMEQALTVSLWKTICWGMTVLLVTKELVQHKQIK